MLYLVKTYFETIDPVGLENALFLKSAFEYYFTNKDFAAMYCICCIMVMNMQT